MKRCQYDGKLFTLDENNKYIEFIPQIGIEFDVHLDIWYCPEHQENRYKAGFPRKFKVDGKLRDLE